MLMLTDSDKQCKSFSRCVSFTLCIFCWREKHSILMWSASVYSHCAVCSWTCRVLKEQSSGCERNKTKFHTFLRRGICNEFYRADRVEKSEAFFWTIMQLSNNEWNRREHREASWECVTCWRPYNASNTHTHTHSRGLGVEMQWISVWISSEPLIHTKTMTRTFTGSEGTRKTYMKPYNGIQWCWSFWWTCLTKRGFLVKLV